MINAVLVFNNSGQPRLTKFYTQLVWLCRRVAYRRSNDYITGDKRTATPNIRNLHPRIQPPQLILQLPPVSACGLHRATRL